MRNPDQEIQQHIDALYSEKEHMSKEIYLLRETIKELELRIETQKQTLGARDESIKKLMEAMQSKGISGKMMEEERMEMERIRTRNIELETRLRHVESMAESRERDSLKVEELRIEVSRKEQEIMAMGAKMKTLEEQHHDYQRHISVLKESLLAKEEHNNMLHNDVRHIPISFISKTLYFFLSNLSFTLPLSTAYCIIAYDVVFLCSFSYTFCLFQILPSPYLLPNLHLIYAMLYNYFHLTG